MSVRIFTHGALGFALLALLFPAPGRTVDVTKTIYVSPSGNDSWSGASIEPDGHGNGPLVSPAKAIKLIRHFKSIPGAPQGGYKVLFDGGTYFLTAPLAFGPEDSGTVDLPNIFAAAPGEKVVFSGGEVLTGWSIDALGRWQVRIPDVAENRWKFSQLFVGDQRRYTARLPKRGYFKIDKELPASSGVKEGFDRFGYAQNDIKPDWYDLDAVEIKVLLNWSSATFHIAELDAHTRTVRLRGKTRKNWYKLSIGTRFRIENVREALTEQGEFYLDRKSGVLTYLPKAGESFDQVSIIAPRLEQLVTFTGANQENKVRNLRFERLTFAHTNWTLPPEGSALGQSALGLPAAVTATNTEHVDFDGIRIAHTGGHALLFGPGCRFNRVTDSYFFDLGGGGILIGDALAAGPGSAGDERGPAAVGNMDLEGNVLSGLGRLHPAAAGIWIGDSPGNRVAKNVISDLYYSAISVGWVWGYGSSKAYDNRISENIIRDVGQGVLSDLAGIYTLGVSPGTEISQNAIANVSAYSYGGFGIALDEGSSEILIQKNLVFMTSDAGLAIHYGRGNIVRNNVFALGRNSQLAIGKMDTQETVRFEHNIVYWTSPSFLLSGPWQTARTFFDNNVYWGWFPSKKMSEGLSWDAWRGSGHDTSSSIENPRFERLSPGEFRLEPESAAVRLGFEPWSVPIHSLGDSSNLERHAAEPAFD